jgi:hypothetical protein
MITKFKICLSVRFAIAFIVYHLIKREWIYTTAVIGIAYILGGIGLFYRYTTYQPGQLSLGFNRPVWWNDVRPLHSTLYILFGIITLIAAIMYKPDGLCDACNVGIFYRYAWILLLLDPILGIYAFMNK